MTRAADEAHIRTLLVRELTGDDFVLHSVQSHDLDGGSGLVEVTAELQRHGRDDLALETAVSRLSLEPSVSSVTWTTIEPEPALLAAAVATPALGYLLGGQGLGAISGSAGAVFALLGVAALFVLIVAMIARGLQLILGAIGTLFAGLAVFVLLNFPSSGASVQGPLLPTFWHVLNRFWIGASASDAFRGIVYFGGQGVGTDVLKLLGWFAVGVVLLALGWFKLRHDRA